MLKVWIIFPSLDLVLRTSLGSFAKAGRILSCIWNPFTESALIDLQENKGTSIPPEAFLAHCFSKLIWTTNELFTYLTEYNWKGQITTNMAIWILHISQSIFAQQIDGKREKGKEAAACDYQSNSTGARHCREHIALCTEINFSHGMGSIVVWQDTMQAI